MACARAGQLVVCYVVGWREQRALPNNEVDIHTLFTTLILREIGMLNPDVFEQNEIN